MITINAELLAKSREGAFGGAIYDSRELVFGSLGKHLAPLGESTSSGDRGLYTRALVHLDYFAQRYGNAPSVRTLPSTHLNNWQFLVTLAKCWKELEIANPPNAGSADLGHRRGLEDAGVRALRRYDVIGADLFKEQEHFSIQRVDLGSLILDLREVMEREGRIIPKG